jgi:subtilase family serine protease
MLLRTLIPIQVRPFTTACAIRAAPGGSVGGTSLASPIIASVYALAGNAANTADGSYPYAHTSGLHDVTSGSNGSCSGSYLCTGKVGYDGPWVDA